MPTFSTLLRDVGSTIPLITAVTVLHVGMYVSVVVIHKIIDYCWYKHPQRAALVASGALVAHSVFFRHNASARTNRVLRLAKFLGLVLPLPVLPAQLGTSVPVVESRVKVVTPRPMTHCLDIEEGHGLGEEVSFFAHQARLERLASVQSTKMVGSIAPAVALLPHRHRRFRMMTSVLRPMTPLNRELPHTSRAVLGDSNAVSGRVPEVSSPTVRDNEIIMSLDSFDETPLVVEPFVEGDSAATDLGDSNVVPIFMPVEAEAISDDNVDMLEGNSSTAFVVDEYAPGYVKQEENPFNLQHVVEPLVDPAVVLNVPASGLATASMRMTSGLATASISSLPAVVSVVDPSVSTPQENNHGFNFAFSFDPSLPPAVSSVPPPSSSASSSSFTFSLKNKCSILFNDHHLTHENIEEKFLIYLRTYIILYCISIIPTTTLTKINNTKLPTYKIDLGHELKLSFY
ncbi:hypothetical protein BDA99DRAFT_587999 [Phascolomyces articulosus]|uniref:Uncharacterized protein n=1 Tax=Phascolomyces articulosus TaxID=60185 RepID=A0AAD5PAC3_9FUNG|nr:hypothetical protein BDA99DRAFT_587999 [Phascolomyces articulosus]